MNSLSSQPKQNLFYSAAQNLLNSSHQNSQSALKKLQLPITANLKEQINNSSLNNLSDRQFPKQNIKPRRLDIAFEMSKMERERSFSNLRNSSFDSGHNVHAYNIRGRFQMINESQERLLEKEQQKNELKDYLLKQIEEKRRRKLEEEKRQQEFEKKDEERLMRQLGIMNGRQSSVENQLPPQQGSVSVYVTYKERFMPPSGQLNFLQSHQNRSPAQHHQPANPNNRSPPKELAGLQLYRANSQVGSNDGILKKLTNIQNDLMLMQQVKTMASNDIQDIRNTIKQQIKKAPPPQIQTQANPHVSQSEHVDHIKLLERQLDCETIFIPREQALQTEFDLLSQTELNIKQQNPDHAVMKQNNSLAAHTNNNNQNQSLNLYPKTQYSTLQNKSRSSSKKKAQMQQLQKPSPQQKSGNTSFHSNKREITHLINNSRLSISQLSGREKSHSADKRNLESKQTKERQEKEKKEKEDQEKKLKLLSLKYPKIQHRTTMLMQMTGGKGQTNSIISSDQSAKK